MNYRMAYDSMVRVSRSSCHSLPHQRVDDDVGRLRAGGFACQAVVIARDDIEAPGAVSV